jgi:hypothetical protein
VREVELELSRKLGLQVSLGSVRYPAPGQVLYEAVVVRQEEPRQQGLSEVARADLVRLVEDERDLVLHVENLKLRGESPTAAVAQLESFMQRSGPLPFDRIHLTAPTGSIELGREDLRFTLRDIAGEFIADRSQPAFRVAYRLPGVAKSSGTPSSLGTRCEFLFMRDRRTDTPVTSVTLKTIEGLPLPARMLRIFFDSEDWLGPNATVEGVLRLSRSGSPGWEADFEGSVHEIDLSHLVSRRFPRHRLTGRANIDLTKATWGDRPGQAAGWRELKGTLSATPGSIGLSLLTALSREMKFRLSPRIVQLDPWKTELEYRALGLSFDIRPSGEIEIRGALGDEFAPEAIVVGPTMVLAAAPRGTGSVHGLIKTLFPVADANPSVVVPLTPESQVLLALPVPREPAIAARKSLGGN